MRLRPELPGRWPGDLRGGVMRIRRAIIIPAIVALGVAGSALVGSALPAVAANASIVHVQNTHISTVPTMFHHGRHHTG